MRLNKAKIARVIWQFFILVFLLILCRLLATPMFTSRGLGSAAALQRKSPSAFVAATGTSSSFQRLPTRTPTLFVPLPTRTPRRMVRPFPLPTANDLTVSCLERSPSDDDLLTVVTTQYSLSAAYQPGDLVQLDEALPEDVASGSKNQIRAVVLGPLVKMIEDMQAERLHPLILSAFRDYAAQDRAHQKWLEKAGQRANSISALPGHSEHQLGVALDFGSPELAELVNDPTIEFHPDFVFTHEGAWLSQHAHEYGFSMSYPRASFETTGFEYEPWHYRYVGVELATYLWETDQFLTKFLLNARASVPCVP